MLRSALEHYARQQRITALGLIAARRARFDTLDRLLATMALFQLTAAEDAAASVPLMLQEQDITPAAIAAPLLTSLLGVASDGRSLDGLLDYTRTPEVTADQFDRIVVTQLQDVARQAAAIDMATRPEVESWIRVLNPPSCSRCVILAGRVYRWSDGFQRHPRCDCRHVPTSSSRDAFDLVTDPRRYFDSLPEAEQNRAFTGAGAEAIRLGADPAKVVNARRGMQTAQVYGRDVLVTSEGTTRRGSYSLQVREAAAARGERAAETSVNRGRRGAVQNYRERRVTTPRLMPESILEIAQNDRQEAVRLLKRFGYVQA